MGGRGREGCGGGREEEGEGGGGEDTPYTDKLDFDVDRKGFFERDALFPANVVAAGVHLVRKRDL